MLNHILTFAQIDTMKKNSAIGCYAMKITNCSDKLRAGEEDYRSLMESLSVGVFCNSGDSQGRILKANPALAEMFGYASVESIMQVAVAELYFKPEDREAFLKEVRQKGQVRNKELQLKKKDGTPFWALCSATVKYHHDGTIRWIEGIIEDITARRRMENSLRKSENRYRRLVNNALVGIYTTNVKGDILFANDALLKMMEFSSLQAFKAEGVLVRYKNPRDREELLQQLEETKKVDNFGIELLTYLGNTRHVILNAVQDEDTISGMIVDITARKIARDNLMMSEERYRTILEDIEEGYFETDIAGNFTFVNDQLCQAVGYSRKELMGMNNRTYSSPETAKKMFQIFNRVFQTGEPAKIVDFEIITKDMTTILAEMSVSLRKDHAGQVVGFRGIVRDITARVKREQERKRFETQLQQAEKFEAIAMLASGIAHDFNNLLMQIMGFIDIAQMDIQPDSNLHQPVSEALKACERAKQLVRQFRIFAQGANPVKRDGSLDKTIRAALQQAFVRHPFEGKIAIADNLWRVCFDELQIEKALRNIFTNAAEATLIRQETDGQTQSGSFIKITAENAVLKAVAEDSSIAPQAGKYVRLIMQDQGIGIAAKNLSRVFDPYFSTKETGTQKGMGLGLSVAYSVIKKHQGYIYVESREGEGTTVNVYLPAASPDL